MRGETQKRTCCKGKRKKKGREIGSWQLPREEEEEEGMVLLFMGNDETIKEQERP